MLTCYYMLHFSVYGLRNCAYKAIGRPYIYIYIYIGIYRCIKYIVGNLNVSRDAMYS